MANTGFVVNATRVDPYKNFKFRVLWDGKTVLGVSKVGSLKRTTEVVKHRSGGQNSYDHKSPGRSSYEGVTLERGITHDIEFEKWANANAILIQTLKLENEGWERDAEVTEPAEPVTGG
jgi:hypothetical protein